MSNSSLDGWQSLLRSEGFEMSAISQVFTQRNTPTDSTVHEPLSVGKGGVTEQLENIAKSLKTDGRKLVVEGDIVINSRSDRRGASGSANRTGSVSLIYIVLEPKLDRIDPRFAHHLVRSTAFQDEFYRFGTGIVADLWSTRYERMSQIRIPLPPLETQQRIADYLDRETAEIDAAIADLDKYMELLEKRRTALLIKETRIRGSAPLTTLGRHAQVILGKTLQSEANDDSDQLISYVRAGNIQPNGVFTGEEKQMWMSPTEIEVYSIDPGDVLVVEGGAGFGRSVTMEYGLPGWGFQNHVIRIRPQAGWVGKFLDYSIRAHKADGLIDLLAVGATIPGFSSERAKNLPIAFLDKEEQLEVVQSLDEKMAEIDTLIEESTRLRDLLLKRRSVLITEVVTGRKQV